MIVIMMIFRVLSCSRMLSYMLCVWKMVMLWLVI